MNSSNNFGYLGYNFQIKLLNQIITDKKYCQNIIDVIDAKYFDNQYFKLIAQMTKEYHEKYQTTPTFETLTQLTKIEVDSEMAKKTIFDMITEVQNASLEDYLWVQEKGLKFCKQQELKKAIGKVNKILEQGDFESYDKCEEYIREAIRVGENTDSCLDVFDDIARSL